MHQSIPIMFSGAPGTPAPSRAPLQSAAILPMAGAPWLSQVTPYPSAFMAPLAWPMYMNSYLPKPVAQQSSMQAECEELDRQRHDLEARELEVEQLTRALNLNLNVRDALAKFAAYMVESCPHTQEHPKVLVPKPHLKDPWPLNRVPPRGSRSPVLLPLRL